MKGESKEAYVGLIPDGQPNTLKVASGLSQEGNGGCNMGIIRREKSENYSVIYNECFQNPTLSARAKGIFAYLMTLPDDWKIYKKELAKHFKEGRDALNKAFDELESEGYITKIPERGKQGRMEGWDYTVYESTELLKTRNTENPTDGEPAPTNNLPTTNTKQTKVGEVSQSKPKATAPSRSKSGVAQQDENGAKWELFWKLYPNKKNKAKSKTAFNRALKRSSFDAMMDAVRAQSKTEDWTKSNGRFVPLASTWLNGDRWDDPVEPAEEEVDLSGYGL